MTSKPNPYLAHLTDGNPTAAHEDGSARGRDGDEGDARLSGVGRGRRRRDDAPHFLKRGELTKRARMLSQPPSTSLPSSSHAHARPHPPLDSSARTSPSPQQLSSTPLMEWWDVPYLPSSALSRLEEAKSLDEAPYPELDLAHQKTSAYVEHPVATDGPDTSFDDSDAPLRLQQTAKERKRARRLAREAKNQETRDKIAVGLLPPPPPKVRLVNLLRVLGDQHVMDPSAVERKVREEMELREAKHRAMNLARKLTPRERAEKALRKASRDLQEGHAEIHAAVFIVSNLRTPPRVARRRVGKMRLTAQRLALTGRVYVVDAREENDVESDLDKRAHGNEKKKNVVVVEGGRKGIDSFRRIMLERIAWGSREKKKRGEGDEEEEEEEEEEDGQDDGDARALCYLAWTGVATKREFEGFAVERVEDDGEETLGRRLREGRGENTELYWNAVRTFDFEGDTSAYVASSAPP